MIENKRIRIYANLSTINNEFTAKINLRINNDDDTNFYSERGKKYKESIECFYNKFYEYFNYYIFKEHTYYTETLEQIMFDLELYNIKTRQDFMYVRNMFIDRYGFCDYYDEDYRGVVLDMMHDTDFKGKRFWAKHYRNLPLEDMDRFFEDFLNSNACQKLYSQNFLNLVKYDEYIIYQENLSESLIQLNYNKTHKTHKTTKPKKTYILKDKNTGYYKIGKSTNPLDREKTLQSEKPTYELIKIFNKDIETQLHKKYKKENVRGEWFNLSKIQLKYICTNYK